MAVPKFIMKLAAKKAAKKLSGVLKTASKKEKSLEEALGNKDIDLVQSMAASRVNLDDSLEEVVAKQDDAAEFLADVRRLNPEKSSAKRTGSPLAKYNCGYNSKKKK